MDMFHVTGMIHGKVLFHEKDMCHGKDMIHEMGMFHGMGAFHGTDMFHGMDKFHERIAFHGELQQALDNKKDIYSLDGLSFPRFHEFPDSNELHVIHSQVVLHGFHVYHVEDYVYD